VKLIGLCIAALAMLFLAGSAGLASGTTYTGSIGSGTGASSAEESYGGTSWGGCYPTLSWSITGSGSAWSYSYTLDDNYSGCPDFTTMVLETSTTFTSSDLSSLTGATDGTGPVTFTSSTYTDLPRSVYGLALTLSSQGNDETITFNSDRAPVWGDFYTYASSGPDYCWNSGFGSGDPDPAATGPANGALDDTTSPDTGWYLLIPDTTGSSSTPEPGLDLPGAERAGAGGQRPAAQADGEALGTPPSRRYPSRTG
jgi:hypothetical protein